MSISNSWEEAALQDLARDVTVGFVGPMASEYVPSGIPFLRSLNVEPYRINSAELMYISERFHQRIIKSALVPGDVVIVRTGKPGTAAVIPSTLPTANCSDLVIVRPGPRLDSRYLAYYLNSAAQNHVSAFTVGAVQQHFNVGSAKDLRIILPPLDEQRAIARILGALDDKIELNRRMNRALETMAQALFKSWFVDFDPVIAKREGRRPFGMDDATASLFPEHFQETTMGPIPSGWRIRRTGDEFNITMGQSPPGSTYNENGDGLSFYQGRTDFGFRYPNQRVYCSAPKRFAERGDTLVSVRAPVGDINMAAERCCIGRGLASVRHKGENKSFTYYMMQSLKEEFGAFEDDGTLFGAISKEGFHNMKISVPGVEILNAFSRIVGPIDARIEVVELQIQHLSALRDTLLPRLLSGEIRVGQAERFAEEA